jgi:hypothetical protein
MEADANGDRRGGSHGRIQPEEEEETVSLGSICFGLSFVLLVFFAVELMLHLGACRNRFYERQ